MSVYLLCVLLFCIGIYCVLTKKHLLKIIIGLGISEYAVHLFFVLLGYRMNGRAPILERNAVITNLVDPLPQALVLTAIVIVIGLAVTALLVALAVRIHEKYHTFDITEIRRLRG